MGPSFIHLDTVTKESKLIDKTIKAWLAEMPPEERENFVEKLCEALSAQGAKTLTDLNSDKSKLIKRWSGLDAGVRATAMKYIKLLFSETAKELVAKKEPTEKRPTAKKRREKTDNEIKRSDLSLLFLSYSNFAKRRYIVLG